MNSYSNRLVVTGIRSLQYLWSVPNFYLPKSVFDHAYIQNVAFGLGMKQPDNISLACFGGNLLKSDDPKFWDDSQILATASTEAFWDDDEPEEKIRKEILRAKHQFHLNRQLLIKHLPRDVTEEEIRDMLCDFPVQCVHIQNGGTGSKAAKVILEDPEMLEEWDPNKNFFLRGQKIPVSPGPTDGMLCVARLPLTMTESQFTDLVRPFGEIRRHFLMISEKTGESKGYGFVEYTSKDSALQAKSCLDGKYLEGWSLVCDWLDSRLLTFESLHSKCLYVDKLPKDFRDMSEFRKVFSSVVNPPYCQIALKNGYPQDWGLVEYSNAEEAEVAQVSLNGYVLRGQAIRISYYIPGVHAINLYLKLLNDTSSKGKGAGLLPEPSCQTIVQSLQNISKQNPIFAQNLQSIILSQIQATQNGGSETETVKKPTVPTAGTNGTVNPAKGGPQRNGTNSTNPNRFTPTNGVDSNKTPTPSLPSVPRKNGSTLPQNISYLKPNQKIGLASNPTPPNGPSSVVSVSPPVGEIAPHTLSVTTTTDAESQVNLWNGLLRQMPPHTASFPPPPLVQDAPRAAYPMAPPQSSFVPDLAANLPLEVQQNLMNVITNPQSLNQLLTSLRSMGQSYPGTPPPPAVPFQFSSSDTTWSAPQTLQPQTLLPTSISVPVAHSQSLFPSWGASPTFLSSPSPQSLFSPFGAPGLIWSQPATVLASPPPPQLSTPIGQKRRFLPSPEPSPEGNYIGQHSQGIGGHYADSYFKRKKKN